MIFYCFFKHMKTTQINNTRLYDIPSLDNSLKYSAYIQMFFFRIESCRVVVLEKNLMSNRYFIYKYIKTIYAQLLKLRNYIKAQVPFNVRILDW